MNKGFRWPEKKIPTMGIPHKKKKKKKDIAIIHLKEINKVTFTSYVIAISLLG